VRDNYLFYLLSAELCLARLSSLENFAKIHKILKIDQEHNQASPAVDERGYDENFVTRRGVRG
jgi:hypothetical protein